MLNQLADSGDDFVKAFHVFLTYPFVDEVVGRDPQVARNLHMGDYTNLSITLDLDLTQALPADGPDRRPPDRARPGRDPRQRARLHRQRQPAARVPDGAHACPQALLKLKEVCQEPANGQDGLRPAQRRSRACPAAAAPAPALPTRCPATRCRRCSAASWAAWAAAAPARGTTPRTAGRPWPSSRTVYDPSLVNLLVPQLVVQSCAKAGARPVITRRTKVQLLIFVVITLLGVTFVGARYAHLDRAFYDDNYTVTAHFPDSGGIFAGSEVTYRGVGVGQVDKLELTDEGVDVVLDIENDYDEIPADTLAVVGNRSAVGEQYVELQPQRDDGPFLDDGSMIEQNDTQIPIATEPCSTHLSTP